MLKAHLKVILMLLQHKSRYVTNFESSHRLM